MRRILQAGLLCGVLLAPAGGLATLLLNGDFSAGLDDWQTLGGIFAGLDQATVTDEGANRSLRYQGVPLGAGTYDVSVDFRSILSPLEPFGFARDSFFASLYFTSTPAVFDPAVPSGFDLAIPLFDLDSAGASPFTGTVGASPLANYSRFTGSFALGTPTTVFAVFELVDLNGITDNSVVLIDNVVLATPIPEPATTALLLGLAGAILVLARRRRE